MRGLARSAAVALMLGLSGCGYALVGRGISIDPSIKRIGVPLFKDSSGRVGLDQKVTQKVIEELLKRHRFDVVQDATGVDAVVDGQITTYRAEPIGFSGGTGGAATQASRYQVTLIAKVRYTKVGEKDSIWEAEAFTFKDEYDIGNAATFFDQEDDAIERLSTSFARSLVSTMLEAF